jgi:hypothetical protein
MKTKKHKTTKQGQNKGLKILREKAFFENEGSLRQENFVYLKVHAWTWHH